MGNAPTNNIPGVTVTFTDLGLALAPPDEGTKVTILGPCSNTALSLREPYRVVNSETAINAFFYADTAAVLTGASGNKWPSEISLAVEEAFSAGAKNVDVIITAYKTGLSAITGYTFEEKYDDLQAAYTSLLNFPVDLVVPAGVYLDEPEARPVSHASYSGLNFAKQLADFCYQSSKGEYTAHGVIGMQPVLLWASRVRVINAPSGVNGNTGSLFSYTGSMTGMDWRYDTPPLATVDDWINFLNTTSNQVYMTGRGPDAGAYSGVSYVNSKLQSYLKGSELSSGSIDTVDGSYLADWQAKESDGTLAIDSKSNPVDAGGYISVVAAPLRTFLSQSRRFAARFNKSIVGNYINTDGAAAYAGFITTLMPHHATTNKPIKSLDPARLLGRSQVDKLIGRRFVTFMARNRFVVALDVTGARNAGRYARSDYVLLSTVRIIHAIADMVREKCYRFIGYPSNAPLRNALKQDIQSGIDLFKEQGAIREASFQITATPEQEVLGELDVAMTVIPAIELIKVNVTITNARSSR